MKHLTKSILLVASLWYFSACESQDEVLPKAENPSEDQLEQTLNAMDLSLISDDNSPTARHGKALTFAPVIDPINGGQKTGKSILLRKSKGLAMALRSKLIPGHAYTVWWIIWNYPQNCQVPGACSLADFANPVETGVELIYADGAVAKKQGVAIFKGMVRVGDVSGSINDLLGLEPMGLLEPKSAQIDLAIRSHGPAIPGQVLDQIGSYAGGCTVFFDPFTEVPDQPGECGEVQAAVHVAQ